MPRGRMHARSTTKKMRNCNHPLRVMSEFLRKQKGYHQIAEQEQRNQQDHNSRWVHSVTSAFRRHSRTAERCRRMRCYSPPSVRQPCMCSFYQDPCLPPYHQTKPIVAVSWWFVGDAGLFVTK